MEKQKIYKTSVILIIGFLGVVMNIQCSKKSTEPKTNHPIASFSYSLNGREIHFIDKSTDSDGEITFWEWEFGDGDKSTVKNPIHRYTNPGLFEVHLTVTDNDGNAAGYSLIVNVANQSYLASFEYFIEECEARFTDQSTDEETKIVAWDWKFGDGFVSDIRNPMHQYAAAGTYQVVLIVTNDIGEQDSISKSITINCAYPVYNDSGIPEDAEVWTWCGSDWGGPECLFDGNYSDSTVPEGDTCFKTTSGSNWGWHTNYAGWGVFLVKPSDHTVDLSVDTCLKFWVKTSENLKVEIQQSNRNGKKFTVHLTDHGWDGDSTWQEITIPASAFQGADLGNIFSPFMITVEQGDKTFYIDHVRWMKPPCTSVEGGLY